MIWVPHRPFQYMARGGRTASERGREQGMRQPPKGTFGAKIETPGVQRLKARL
jgi:hypothetical protein